MTNMTDFMAELDKGIGQNDTDQMVTQFIDTGYEPLNEIISGRPDGGLPFGRMVEMYGPSSAGKTALATKWLVEAQRMGGVAGFVDWERSFNVGMAKSFGLKDERPYWLYTKPKTWEEGNTWAAKAAQIVRKGKYIDDNAPILFVFDSIASAIPHSVLYDGKTGEMREIDSYTMNDTTALARVSSTTLKVMAQYCEEFNATFLYLNQIRTKPGVTYGDPTTTPGGVAMEFYASARISLTREKIVEKKEFTGQRINMKCVKSKFTKPFRTASMEMAFDDAGVARFDITSSLLEYAKDNGLIEYNKPRFTWTDGKKYFASELAAKIDAEGLQDELRKLIRA